MKEFKLDDMIPLKAIQRQIWTMFDILRSEKISSEEYYFILFLLSLYKENIISSGLLSLYKDGIISSEELFKKTDLNLSLIEGIHDSDDSVSRQYLSIFKTFEPALNSLSTLGLNSIFAELSKIDKKILSQNFSYIFDSVLYQITKSQGRYGGEFIQPLELTRFICTMADLPKNSKVFNPFAGLASFGVYLDRSQDYYGQELNEKTWALGVLRIIAYGRGGSSRYVHDDSILHWPDHSEKFDLVIANPPYGMRLSPQYKEVGSQIRSVEQFLIEKGVNSLNEKGKLIALLPQGFLFRGRNEKRMREHLIEEDLIDTIISFPGGLMFNTGIPLVIIVIDKNKKWPGKVRFIDAKKFVESKNQKVKVLNDFGLNSVVRASNRDSDIVRIIDNVQIKESDYNLNVPRYFQKQIDGVKLSEIVEFIRGRKVDIPDKGKQIRIRDLKDDKVDFKLDVSNVEESEVHRAHLKLIDESCLLLAIRWKTLKPTLFEFSDAPIILNPDILAFKINEKIADIDYLINELHADYVQEQLESYRLGATIPMIKQGDLLEVVIKLPSLEEQRAKVQGIMELSDKIKTLQKERNALAHGNVTRQFNEFASLKHTLGRPRQNILDWTDNLLHFMSVKREGTDALNKSFHDFYETDIISALKEIKRDVNFMTDVLEKGENGFVVEEFEKSIIPLYDVNSLIKELSNSRFNFKINTLLLKAENLKERGIYGNKILLKTLIDNLLTNAQKYGFDKKETGNEVVFELTEVDDFLSMEVRNNGKPFPKNFDREKFITKYSTADANSGTGLGGYDIHRIASEFKNPEWELVLNSDLIYSVKFKFQFPIKLIN